MTRPGILAGPLLCAAVLTAGVMASLPAALRTAGYVAAPEARPDDTLRVRLVRTATRARKASRVFGAIVPGYLSARGLPPKQGRFTLTRPRAGLSVSGWRHHSLPPGGSRPQDHRPTAPAATVALAYVDQAGGRPTYVFRVDAGVFETDVPGPLLDVASHPVWLDSVAADSWVRGPAPGQSRRFERRSGRQLGASPPVAYADSLYQLFGSPRAAVGLIGSRGPQGRTAG